MRRCGAIGRACRRLVQQMGVLAVACLCSTACRDVRWVARMHAWQTVHLDNFHCYAAASWGGPTEGAPPRGPTHQPPSPAPLSLSLSLPSKHYVSHYSPVLLPSHAPLPGCTECAIREALHPRARRGAAAGAHRGRHGRRQWALPRMGWQRHPLVIRDSFLCPVLTI